VWTPGPIWNFAEKLALAGIHSRIAQPLTRCYNDCAIPAQNNSANSRALDIAVRKAKERKKYSEE